METGTQEGRKPKCRWPKRLVLALLALIAACVIAFAVYVSDCYHAGDEALAAVEAGEQVAAAQEQKEHAAQGNAQDEVPGEGQGQQAGDEEQVPVVETSDAFAVGNQSAQYGLVLYPGAKIEPAAYVPLARKLASRGVFCVVVKMPFNIASLDINAATRVMAEYPQVGSWWIGGHSLGGAMAAQYASEHGSQLAGIVFLAAYSAADLSDTNLKACVVYGTDDGVLNFDKFEQAKRNLPADASVLAIEGGNHAGFGCYGAQRYDGQASISPSDQQDQTAQAVAQAILG